MHRLLTARHLATSVLAGLTVFVLFTSVIGFAVAQDDSPQEAPELFVVENPQFGDEASYQLTLITTRPQEMEHDHRSEQDTFDSPVVVETGEQEPHEEHPDDEPPQASATTTTIGPVNVSFVRHGIGLPQRDADGILHDVERISWGSSHEDFATAHIINTGKPIGDHHTWSESYSETYSSPLSPVVQSESYSISESGAYFYASNHPAPCILRHGFQDAPQVLSSVTDAFGPCSVHGLLHTTWEGGPMQVLGVETKDGVASLHLRGMQSDLTLDIWLEPNLPYPARIVADTEEDHVELVLQEFTAGTDGNALAYIDTPRDALPELEDQGQQPTGLSFAGIDHPFPVEEAYNAAYNDPMDTAFREWVDANPNHTVVGAGFNQWQSSMEPVSEDRRMDLALQGPDSEGQLFVTRTTIEGPTGEPIHTYDFEFYGQSGRELEVQMPSNYPSMQALSQRWQAYLPGGLTVSPLAYWYNDHLDAWEIGVYIFEDESDIPFVYGVGDHTYRDELGFATIDSSGRLLYMNYHKGSFQTGQDTIVDDAPAPAASPTASEEHAEPTPLAAKPEAPWIAPTPVQAAGAAGAAVATGALVYLWPAVKGLPFFGLFSRLRRPELLGHPSRRKILDVIETEPGIHFQEMHRRTGLSNGNLVHHIRKLTQAGMVTERRSGGYTCYFAQKDANRQTMDAAPVLRSAAARKVLRTIHDSPGICTRDIIAEMSLGSSTVHYHLKRLEQAGLAQAHRDGRDMTFVATDVAQSMSILA